MSKNTLAVSQPELTQLRELSARVGRDPLLTQASTIAYELQAPHGNVCFALEELQGERKTLIRRLAFGLWDVIEEAEKIA